jgi:hypothetical protein
MGTGVRSAGGRSHAGWDLYAKPGTPAFAAGVGNRSRPSCEPASVVQRWASDGMPLRRQGWYVETRLDELNTWLGKESGKPVHVATENTDLTAELKRGLLFVRREKEPTAGTELSGQSKKVRRK